MSEEKQQFSSRDFDQVASNINFKRPDRLVHHGVCDAQCQRKAEFDQERGHGVHVVDLPTKTISMTIGDLEPGQSTRTHRHNYEAVIYVVQGVGYSLIEGERIDWQAGDAFYVPVWSWHSHVNSGASKARYVAAENAPLLQNMGNIALREEADIHPEAV